MQLNERHKRMIHRAAVGTLFFLLGLCYASWASRIPAIQEKLQLSVTNLGFILFSLPCGNLISLPLAGWLIHKAGSKITALTALVLYAIILVLIGYSASVSLLVICLFLFGMTGNMVNIAINTQALGVEHIYNRSILASFHGLWSLAGFAGAFIGTLMTGYGIEPQLHFIMVAAVTVVFVSISSGYTLKEDYNRKEGQPLFAWPEKSLIQLGLLTLCSMICEGAMFDWSGVYFQKVVKAPVGLIGLGYTVYMACMATGRFMADSFYNRFGLKLTLQASGLMTALGLLLAVIFPHIITAVAGFLMVGLGVSSVVPLVYSTAGRSSKLSAGVALAAVTTIGFFGLLIGPVIIGLVAGITSLRISFLIISCMGFVVFFLASKKITQNKASFA